ncbi:MAG: hypothetical protein RLN90_04065 [Balneolaceae bacterium]
MKTKLLTLFIVLTGIASSIFWIEAEKEIEILCSLIQPNQSMDEVTALLRTGEHLEYHFEGEQLQFNSLKNLQSINCFVQFDNLENVETIHFSKRLNIKIMAILLGSVTTFLLMIFQIALASGKPLGEYAWGGFNKKLPNSLRKASAVSAVVLLIAIFSLLSLEFIHLIPEAINAYIVAVFALLFLISILGNLVSVSKKEKKVMIPASIMLFLCYFIGAYASF